MNYITVQQLTNMCKDLGLKHCSTFNKGELCNVLGLPPPGDKPRGGPRRSVVLVEINSGERTIFKSIYSAAKAIGRNPGSIHLKKNTEKTLRSRVDDREYQILILES